MIRDSLIFWRNTTELLIRVLNVQDEDKRDSIIEQVEKLLIERDVLQTSIEAPFTEEEKELGQELIMLNQELDNMFTGYMKDIRIDISDQQKKKVSVNAYVDPYGQVYRDGTFYDKKK